MSNTPTTTNVGIDHKYDGAVEALRDVHDEASLWHLSDELVKIAPTGVQSVQNVVDQATARGIPTKSVNTLRLYRDVAIRFPATERVGGVSFSAHREAITMPTVAEAKALLTDLAVKHGAGGVTVTTVKAAIGAATGKVKAAPVVKVKSPYVDIAPDLSAGGKAFVAAIDSMLVKGVTLDGLHAGITAVLAAVEVKRSKAARKAAASKGKAAPAPARPVKVKAASGPAAGGKRPARQPATPAAAGSKAGDLRDL